MIINLCFHGIGPCLGEREPGESGYWVSEDVFLRTLDTARELPNVRVSFDDGNRSDVELALPALRERGMSATFFALAGRLDDPASLSPADLRELRNEGMELGSHGWAHVPWRGMTGPETHREFIEARVVLEEASQGSITQAALPLGRYDRQTLRQLRKSGYETVYTSDRFPARAGSWLQARYSATASDTVESIASTLARRDVAREVRARSASLVKRLR